MKPILCLGDICADLILPLGAVRRARRGEPIPVRETDAVFRHGGSVANTAVGLAGRGLPVLFCGTCGDDAYGHALAQELQQRHVDTACLRFDRSVPTLLIAITVDEDGDRVAFATHRTGASQHRILPEQLPSDLVGTVGWLHCSGMMLREEPAASTQLAAMRQCHNAGIPVSLDINARIESRKNPFFCRNLKEAAEYCTVLLGSLDTELPLLAGNAEPASLHKLASDSRIVIARSGEHGATVFTEDKAFYCPAFDVPVSDTIGAGDAYNAGFIASVLQGQSLPEANRTANAVAAFCVMHAGGRSVPTQAELDAILNG